jgi:transcriptional regulator with XRE-family HTH domain
MTDIRKVFGANVRTYRKALGISQAKLAELAGTATNYLAMIELGKKFPSATMIERIAAALGRDPLELFGAAAPSELEQTWQNDILAEIEKLIIKKRKTLVLH